VLALLADLVFLTLIVFAGAIVVSLLVGPAVEIADARLLDRVFSSHDEIVANVVTVHRETAILEAVVSLS
jgi:hypothetical protein